jgi:hypothetical protein
MEQQETCFKNHPVHGDVRFLGREVIRDDERQWIWVRRLRDGALLWFPKDETIELETFQP